jgi:hypothetical protein
MPVLYWFLVSQTVTGGGGGGSGTIMLMGV